MILNKKYRNKLDLEKQDKINILHERIIKLFNEIEENKKEIQEIAKNISDLTFEAELIPGKTQSVVVSNEIESHLIRRKSDIKRKLYIEDIKRDYVDMPPLVRECFFDTYELILEKYNEVCNIPELKKEIKKYICEDKPKIKYSIFKKKNYVRKRMAGVIEAMKEDMKLENELRGY